MIFEKSNQYFEKSKRLIPSASQTFSKSFLQYPLGSAPLFIERGEGSYVWDIDGNKFIDLVASLLPIVLGHGDKDVNDAIMNQIDNGIVFSLPSPLETKLADLTLKYFPAADMIKFAKNGSDVTSAAVRVSRHYTKKEVVIAIGYHGWHDWYVGSTARDFGVPDEIKRLTKKIPYNDFEQLEKFVEKNSENIACLIMEPMSFEAPKRNYLKAVRDLCTKSNIVMIFDEVITGFRFDLGGAQNLFKVTPDLTCLGKAMGNGMPISALLGRQEIMKEFEDVFFSSTFGGETLSLAAAIATIEKLDRTKAIEKINALGTSLNSKVNELIVKHNLSKTICLSGLPQWTRLQIKDQSTQ